MTRYFKALVLMVAIFFIAGNAWSTVSYAPEGKGDVLIFPFYAAFDGGWQTKLTVVNTDPSLSSVAKVVVRSPKYSGELVDFLIYLSPSDVWTGTLKYDSDFGGPMIYSDDDSIISGFDRQGYENKTGTQTMSDFVTYGNESAAQREFYTTNSMKNLVDNDYAEMGYAYVINVATWNAGDRPVDKDTIVDTYLPFFSEDKGASLSSYGGADTNMLPDNVLAGWMDFQIGAFGVASMKAVTLKDYQNKTKIVPQLETVIAPDSIDEFDESGGSTDTTLAQVEYELAKQDIAMPYMSTDEAFSTHIFTFPTKYTKILQYASLDDTNEYMDSRSEWPGFVDPDPNLADEDYTAEVVKYNGYLFDLQEKSPAADDPIWSPAPAPETYVFPYEQNLNFSSDFVFDEGWINYEFNVPENPAVEGIDWAPVIPVSLDFTLDGMSFKYGAWTQGTKEYNTTAADQE